MDKPINKKRVVEVSGLGVEHSQADHPIAKSRVESKPELPVSKIVRRNNLRAGRKDLANIKFDTSSPLLKKSWHSYASHALCLNAYPNGITISQHDCSEEAELLPESFQLRLRDTREFRLPRGKYLSLIHI